MFRTERRTNKIGVTYPWVIQSTAMVNHYLRARCRSTAKLQRATNETTAAGLADMPGWVIFGDAGASRSLAGELLQRDRKHMNS